MNYKLETREWAVPSPVYSDLIDKREYGSTDDTPLHFCVGEP